MLYSGAMKLLDYLRAGRGRAAQVAAAIGKTPSFVSQLANGLRPVPADKCPDIEVATGYVVRRWDLRPHDWHRIWPDLVGMQGAPTPQLEADRAAA